MDKDAELLHPQMERSFKCGKPLQKKSAASTHLNIQSSFSDNVIKSAPHAKSKEGQEINLTLVGDVAALKPPNYLIHQQDLMNNLSSFINCWRISFDGSVVRGIIAVNDNILSAARPPRQIAKAPSVILHEERLSLRRPDGQSSGSPMLLP